MLARIYETKRQEFAILAAKSPLFEPDLTVLVQALLSGVSYR
jgi:hypothetical protein